MGKVIAPPLQMNVVFRLGCASEQQRGLAIEIDEFDGDHVIDVKKLIDIKPKPE